jgi:hypothetical protein
VGDYSGGPPPIPPPPSSDLPVDGDRLPRRGLGDILSAALQIYRKNAAQLLLIVAVVTIPLSILSYLLADVVFAANSKTVTIGNQSVKVTEPRSFFVFLLALLVTLAIGVIITAILQAAILRAAAQATIGDPVDVEASYRWGFARFGAVLLVSILVGLAVGIGFLLLIIPGIILLVMFSVAIPVVVVENRRGTDAMRRSWELVSNHFWHVLGVILVAAILAGIVSGLVSAIGGNNGLLRAIFQAIAQIITAPFTALVSVLLYLDLRARRENLTASGLRAELATNR